MIFFITNLIISFFIFLYCLYLLARDDFVLLRKNVTLEQIFNYAFASGFICLVSARVFYVFFHPSFQYINPLVFLIFIYFPGLSLVGGLMGVSIFLLFLSRKKKIPRGRIYDIFSLSFFPAFVGNMIIAQLVNTIFTRKFSFIMLSISVIYSIIFGIFFLIFQKGKVKEGTIGISTLLVFSFLSLVQNILLISNKKSLFSNREIITLCILLGLAILLLVKQKMGGKKNK